MFQYAAGLAIARHIGAKLKVITSHYDKNNRYYHEWSKKHGRPFLLDRLNVGLNFATDDEITRFDEIVHLDNHEISRLNDDFRIYRQPGLHYDEACFNVLPDTLLIGYFQSELYFKSVEREIRDAFKGKNGLSDNSRAYMRLIRETTYPVAIHVRRGDYLAYSEGFPVCGIDYYKQAIYLIDRLSSGKAHYFIFSDDPDDAKKLIGKPGNSTMVTGNKERPWEDMTLIGACRDQIIANSSFSWWGAWLNPRADKNVIAPRQWSTRNKMFKDNKADMFPTGKITINTFDLYPSGWITI